MKSLFGLALKSSLFGVASCVVVLVEVSNDGWG